MAYMNQEKKSQIAAAMKPILKKYGIKATLSVSNHSSINLNIKSGNIDFFKNEQRKHSQVNVYWIEDNYDGIAKEFLLEALNALKSAGYYNNSDAMIDYFDTAYYMHINIGFYDKPYIFTGA